MAVTETLGASGVCERQKRLLLFQESELLCYCLGRRRGGGDVRQALEDVGLRAEGLGLLEADALVRLQGEVGCAEDECYTAGLSEDVSWEFVVLLGLDGGEEASHKAGCEAHDGNYITLCAWALRRRLRFYWCGTDGRKVFRRLDQGWKTVRPWVQSEISQL